MKTQLAITTHPVLVALGATLLFIESGLHFHAPFRWLDVGLVFSLTLAAYSFPYRKVASISHKTINWVFFLVAVFSAVMSILLGGMLSRMLVISSCFVLFLSYRFGSALGFSFRGSLLLKGPVIAICWTIITVYMPVNIHNIAIDSREVVPMALLNFCMVLAMAWLCDLADLKNDAEKGLQTISVRLGPERTILMALMIMMACTMVLAFLMPLSSFMLKGVVLADMLTGLAIIAVTKLPSKSAKWMVDALLLCKPLAMICILA